jgi:exodeoxyribonuclease VII small subunit
MTTPAHPRKRQQPEAVEKLSFEEAFAEAQEIIARLGNGSLSLDESIAVFERGMRLVHHCDALLGSAELRVQQLDTRADGTLAARDITIETEE